MIDLATIGKDDFYAMKRLGGPENTAILDCFTKEIETATRGLVLATDTVLIHRLQGRIMVLREIITTAQAARNEAHHPSD